MLKWLFLIGGTYYLGKYYLPKKQKESKTRKTGVEGEKAAVEYLHRLMKEYNVRHYHILQNVILEYAPNRTTEIDIVCLTRKGIYVIEVKNYKGKITGKQEDHQWTQQVGYKNPKTYSFYNPVRQNQTHINTLKRYVDVPLYSWVWFGEKAELHIDYAPTADLHIRNINTDTAWFKEYAQMRYVMSGKHLDRLKKKIDVTVRSKASLKAHVRRLQFDKKK